MDEELKELTKSISGLFKTMEALSIAATALVLAMFAVVAVDTAYHWVINHWQQTTITLGLISFWIGKAIYEWDGK